jgi:hypothetical protein
MMGLRFKINININEKWSRLLSRPFTIQGYPPDKAFVIEVLISISNCFMVAHSDYWPSICNFLDSKD